MKFPRLLLSGAFFLSVVVAAPSSLTVCIVGAGPAGLVAASKLEAKGYKAVVFEKQNDVGGKCQAVYEDDGTFHPLGALLFSNATYTETLKIVNHSGVNSVPFNPGATWYYNYTSGATVQQAAPSLAFMVLAAEELVRYTFLWLADFAPYSVIGYKNGVPAKLSATSADWLASHNFQALPVLFEGAMVAFGYGDLRQTPILYMLQYLTPDILSFFAGLHPVYFIDFHKVFVNFAKSSVKSPIRLGANIVKIDRSEQQSVIYYYQNGTDPGGQSLPDGAIQSQACSRLILAFPPTVSALTAANLELTTAETEVFGQVGLINYFSGAVRLTAAPHDILFEATPTSQGVAPPANDEPIAFLDLQPKSNVVTTWSWGAYGSTSPISDAYAKLLAVLSKLNKDPRVPNAQPVTVTDQDVLGFLKQDYFPHFDTLQLKAGWYDKFNALQGQNGTYFASGLNGVETVEFAIRAAEDVVLSYFS